MRWEMTMCWEKWKDLHLLWHVNAKKLQNRYFSRMLYKIRSLHSLTLVILYPVRRMFHLHFKVVILHVVKQEVFWMRLNNLIGDLKLLDTHFNIEIVIIMRALISQNNQSSIWLITGTINAGCYCLMFTWVRVKGI